MDDYSAVAVRTTCFGLAIWGMWQYGRVDNMARDATGRIARGISVYIVKRGA